VNGKFGPEKAQTPVPITVNGGRSGKRSKMIIGASSHPWYQVDLKVDGLPIKEVLLIGL